MGMNWLSKLDSMWQNVLTGRGTSRDKRTFTTINSPITFSQKDLDSLFAGSSLAHNIVKKPIDNMLREWFEVKSDDSDDEVDTSAQAVINTRKLQQQIKEVAIYARLYGTAFLVLGIDDGSELMSEPLNLDRAKSLVWTRIYNRYNCSRQTMNVEPTDENFGKTEVYHFAAVSRGGQTFPAIDVHHTRLLRFDGQFTTDREAEHNDGFSDSVLVTLYEDIRAYDEVKSASEVTITDFTQSVFRMQGLQQMLLADGRDAVSERLAVVDQSRSMLRAVLLDENESFEKQTTQVTGLSDLVDIFMTIISGATGIPATVLFGRAPAGMNATGESDMRNWYDMLTSERQLSIEPQIEYLIKILLNLDEGPTKGVEPDNWTIHWASLWQMSDLDQAEIRLKQSAVDQIYIQLGVLDTQEVRDSRFIEGAFSPLTTLDETTHEEFEGELPDIVDENGQPLEAPQGQAGTPGGVDKLADVALNGAQVTSLVEIVKDYSAGLVAKEAAREIILSAFPQIDTASVERMLQKDVAVEAKYERQEQAAGIPASKESDKE